MRNLGAAYDAAKAGASDWPCSRVIITGHGIEGVADPYTVTDVDSVSVSRALRDTADSASVTVGNADGSWDPQAGQWAVLVNGAARVTIEMGEVLANVPTYWPVFTGSVVGLQQSDDIPDMKVLLTLRNRVKDLAQLQITSPLYGAALESAWQVNDIIEDLLTRFADFAPADFDLSALDFPVYRIQFEQESLWSAVGSCLLPKGLRPYFAYDGTLTSGPLVPASWTSVLSIPSSMVKRAEGPHAQAPSATRIFVTGGPAPEKKVVIGDAEVYATTRVYLRLAQNAGVLSVLSSDLGGGDCVSVSLSLGIFGTGPIHLILLMAGPRERVFRPYYSYTSAPRVNGVDKMSVDGLQAGIDGPDSYNATMLRYECAVSITLGDTIGDNEIGSMDFDFDVLGYPEVYSYPPVDVQAWSDPLIAIHGEIPAKVTAKVAQSFDDACTVAENELIFVEKTTSPMDDVPLAGLDLRIEPGDVVTANRRGKPAVDLWVQGVTQSADGTRGSTVLTGYAV